jgi:hypothetical protein
MRQTKWFTLREGIRNSQQPPGVAEESLGKWEITDGKENYGNFMKLSMSLCMQPR